MWIPVQVQMLQLSSESQESPGILSWLVTASLQGMSPSSATWLWLISSTSALLASSVQPRCSPQNFLSLYTIESLSCKLKTRRLYAFKYYSKDSENFIKTIDLLDLTNELTQCTRRPGDHRGRCCSRRCPARPRPPPCSAPRRAGPRSCEAAADRTSACTRPRPRCRCRSCSRPRGCIADQSEVTIRVT